MAVCGYGGFFGRCYCSGTAGGRLYRKRTEKELETLDYLRFKGKDLPDHFGILGKSISLLLSLGIYNTDDLEDWVDELLNRKGIRRFKDVEQSGRKLKITASDLTEKRLLVLPDDLAEFTVDRGILHRSGGPHERKYSDLF